MVPEGQSGSRRAERFEGAQMSDPQYSLPFLRQLDKSQQLRSHRANSLRSNCQCRERLEPDLAQHTSSMAVESGSPRRTSLAAPWRERQPPISKDASLFAALLAKCISSNAP